MNSNLGHPVPLRYHQSLYIGEKDRRGSIIDFRVPPVIVNSPRRISEYKQAIFAEHVDAEKLPMVYHEGFSFMVLRPTALPHRSFVREEIESEGLSIREEFEIENFMLFSDTLYVLNPSVDFHWKWRAIMRALHDSGTQDQNRAIVFVVETDENPALYHEQLASLKKRIRHEMGETPVIVKSEEAVEIALGIHHLHVSEFERVGVEYNTLMHARHFTSIFA